MTTLNYTVTFHKTVLASFIGLCISSSCFALEAMSDEKLSDTTGEGIALLPQDAYMVFRGTGPNETKNTLFSDRTKDTGYIHYIPVGPLTQTTQDTNKDTFVNSSDHSVGKADLYLYGLAFSKSDGNSNSRIASSEAAAKISSWGTAANPWLLRVGTQPGVPTFTPDAIAQNGTITPNTGTGSVSFLAFEAPLYENIYSFATDKKTVTSNAFSKDVGGEDAYNLKLGLWADAFVLDQSKAETDLALYNLGQMYGDASDTTRANRLRLQMISNGFSLNGSRLQLFQTLDGATNSDGLSTFYNNTLGLAGVIRLNSGDGSKLLGTSTANSWTMPANLMNRVLRISTQECGLNNTNGCTSPDAQGLLYTPAVIANNVGIAPTFSDKEGIYIYNLNTNLVLGSLYQPLILGSDGKNFSLELARIPNKESIYKEIYTDYTGADTSYKGSTCNVYNCGTSTVAGYQGSTATHSSISIGSVYSPDAGKTLLADKTAGAVGVSFNQLSNSTTAANAQNNLGSAVIDGILIQHMKITTKGL